MNYIIVGSRKGANYRILREHLDSLDNIDCIISGGASGVDLHAKIYARRNSIPYVEYPANWDVYGKSAGWFRNNRMAEENPGASVIAFWNGESKGTSHWFDICENVGLPLEVVDL